MKKSMREMHGGYEIKRHPGGGFSVFGAGIRERGFYVPSDLKIKERYGREGETQGLITVLQYRAIPYCGKRNLLKGREALGLLHPKRENPLVTKEEIVSSIKNFWNPEDVNRSMAGEEIKLPGIASFRKKNERQYHAAQRTKIFKEQSGFEGIMNEVYPGLYQNISRRTKSENVNSEHLGEILLSRFYSGLPLSKTSFLTTHDTKEKKLLRQIESLASSDLFRKAGSYTNIVMRLTGLKRDDVTDSRIGKDNARLTEELTEMFFNWAFLIGLKLSDFIEKKEIYRSRDMVQFSYDEKEGRADLRVGNQAIEVKTGTGVFNTKMTINLIEKYAAGKTQWYTSELLGRSLTIFHQRKELYKDALDAIEKAGIKTMSYEQFHSCLIELVSLMKKNFQNKISILKPKIHNLDYLIKLHEEISLKPCVLMRRGNYDRREWSHSLLKSLTETAREMQNKENNNKSENVTEQLEKFFNGKIESSNYGQLLVVERKLSEINSGEIAEYIKKHKENLLLDNIRRRAPQLEHILKKKILFFDTENCGLRYTDPIFMIGLADFSDGINLTSLVARDYSEEKAVIKYFLDSLSKYDVFFTYNGSSFDIPRISERAKQNGLMLNHTYRTLKDIIGERHIDLYHLLRKKVNLPDAKLQTIEKVIFGHDREGDISGNKIPKVYSDYVYGNDGAEKMAKVIHHNMLDTASLIGVLVYLSS